MPGVNKQMNSSSQSKFTYTVFKNAAKNKTYIQCAGADSRPANFSLKFADLPNSSSYSLREILGFKKMEYMNNNIYVSEKHPINNILQNVFLRVFGW